MTTAAKPYQVFPRPFGTGGFVNPQAAAGTFTTGDLDVEGWDRAVFVLDVTAITGSGTTLDVQVQGRDPVSGKYILIGTAFSQSTTGGGANTQSLTVDPLMFKKIRAQWVIGGGTPSVTFTLGAVFRSEG